MMQASLTKNSRRKRKACRFCVDQDVPLDYKEPRLLAQFLTDNAKILPRRITGNCARHQRRLTQEIKRARILATLPFTVGQ